MLIAQTPANLNCSEFELLGFNIINFAVPVTTSGNKMKKKQRQLEVQTKASLSLILVFSVNCREVKTTSTRIDKMNFFYLLLTLLIFHTQFFFFS